MLQIQDLSVAYANKVLFENASVQLYANQRVGLVGKNGVGKTSLLKIILNKLQPDKGEVNLTNNVLISYIEQEIISLDEKVIDYVLNSHYVYKEQLIDLPEFYQLRPAAEKLLINLGFKHDELELPLSNFSGGWQMRANLAKALFCPSDILLLDEPTNHLDIETVLWLEKLLLQYTGLAIIISHDREFLDNVTTHTLHIANSKMELYGGNYSIFERTLAERIMLQQKHEDKMSAKIAHLQSFVDRFRAKATKAKQAQSRMKMIEKLQFSSNLYSEHNYVVEFFELDNVPNLLCNLLSANIGYLDNILIKNVNLQLFSGARIGLLGKNGRGKSSLIKSIISQEALLSGIIEIADKVKIGYFAQNTVDMLNLQDTPFNLVSQLDTSLNYQYIMNYLGKFGFTGDMVNSKIEHFSGGEKSRLVLAMIILQRPNILFLDEPTNHLDMAMREELARGLQDFSGALVLVSHDKFMLQSVVDEYYLIDNNKLEYFTGSLEDYYQYLFTQTKEENLLVKKSLRNDNKLSVGKQKSQLTMQITKLEKEITNYTRDKDQLELEMVKANQIGDFVKMEELQMQIEEVIVLLNDIELRWLELSDKLELLGSY